MARIAGGMDELEWARERVTKARSAEDLRQAQAVLLPLELGLSLEQTASAIGRSVSMTCKLRNRRRRELAQELEPKKHKHQLRNHAHASLELEAAALDQVLAGAAKGGIVIIPQLLPAFEKALGKSLNLAYPVCCQSCYWVSPLAAVECLVGRCRGMRGDSENRVECSHRIETPVEAKYIFVEVCL